MFLSFLLQEDFISFMMECFPLTYSIKRRYSPELNVYYNSRCAGYLWLWTLSTGVLTEFISQICSWRGVDIRIFWIKFSYLGSFYYLCDSVKQKCNQILFSVPDSLILWIDEVHIKLQSPKWTIIEFLISHDALAPCQPFPSFLCSLWVEVEQQVGWGCPAVSRHSM